MDLLDIMGISTIMESLRRVKQKFFPAAEYQPNEITPVKFNYRPQFLSQYIGQQRAKDLVNLTLEKIKTIKPVHIIISGTKGCGKSTLANIIANEIGLGVTYHIGGAFSMKALQNFLIKNQDDKVPNILFIDEIHNLPKAIAEYLYPILEDFILPEGKNIRLAPFIFIGATTEKNILIKKFAPLVDRCGCDIVLEQYTADDIKEILKQYNDKIYQENIEEDAYNVLSKNTRFTPRVALSMFDDLIVCKDLKRVLDAHRIIKDSLTTTDIGVIKHLAEVGKPVGIEALATISGVTREDFQYIIEPFLLQNNYLTRTARGRLITEKGKKLLEELKNA